MNEVYKRLLASVNHLAAVDDFFNSEDQLYREYSQRLKKVKSYSSFCEAIYKGDFERQMQLSDLLEYVIVSRGGMWASESDKEDYMRIIFYTMNQLLLQEHITRFADLRKKFLSYMEALHLDFWIESEKYEECYNDAKASNTKLTYTDNPREYKAIDRLLPKSVGTVIELAVYLYMLRHKVGYVIPLLLQQRLLCLDDHIVSPDFLVVKEGRLFGVEVEQSGSTGKTIQSNIFMEETGIPVLNASIPTSFPLPCYACDRWMLFCDNVIDKFCDFDYEIESDWIACDQCNEVIYYGRLEKGGTPYHYHLECVRKNEYVRKLLEDEKQRKNHLVAYFPAVQGLERLQH